MNKKPNQMQRTMIAMEKAGAVRRDGKSTAVELLDETHPFMAAEIKLIKDLDALVAMSRSRGHMIPTKGVQRAISAARDQGLHNLADEAEKLSGLKA